MFKVGDKVRVLSRGTARPMHYLDVGAIATVVEPRNPATGSYRVAGPWRTSGGPWGDRMRQWIDESELEAAP